MFVVGSTTCLSCDCADDGLFRRADHGSFQALVSPAGNQILRCIADSHHLALTAYMAAEQALAQHTALRPQCAWMQLLLAVRFMLSIVTGGLYLSASLCTLSLFEQSAW